MDDKFRIKGVVYNTKHQPAVDIHVKAYDKNGVFIADARTDDKGFVDFESASRPTTIKFISQSRVIASRDITNIAIGDNVIDIGQLPPLCVAVLNGWHITGIVRDKMSGDPLPGLRVEVWDEDTSNSAGPFYDPLWKGSPIITNDDGRFNTWFNTSDFIRGDLSTERPDIVVKIFDSKGVLLFQMPVDQDVSGSPHVCYPFCPHKGKEYIIDIDYVTVAVNKVGPIDVANINSSGRAISFGTSPLGNPILDRPFGGRTTISGRVWGAKVKKWKLYDISGFIDSDDARFNGLKSTSVDPNGFKKLAEGTNKIWDGPIYGWNTRDAMDGVHTVILVVWDQNENEYHKTQLVFVHNTSITPPVQITSPAPGSEISKKATKNVVDIIGTADDDFFQYYYVHWAGPAQTEITADKLDFKTAGDIEKPKNNALTAKWDINDLPVGPYMVRLETHDKTIVDDGSDWINDWTWSLITIVT